MTITSLETLFDQELSDIYSAEQQIIDALPKLRDAATGQQLKDAFDTHLEETRGHVERLNKLQDLTSEVSLSKSVECKALKGLVAEAQELIDSSEQGDALDAGLIGAAQKVEHYEIASYGTLCALAQKLGYDKAADLLAETLQEEKNTDIKLTEIAEATQ